MTDSPGARTLLVAGTASHVGKSTVAAGLCRHLADRGVDVAPFKAQNMSNNARAVPRPAAVRDGARDAGPDADADATADPAFGEVGVSQYVAARAARVRPTTDHNPVLLKPRGGGESQLVLDGVAVAHYRAGTYYDRHWTRARERAVAAHARLTAAHEVVVAEGAGSIAEINLHDRDLANVETVRFADADVLLVADIERGGVFASLVGTLELVPDDVRERVVGAVVTKFRGDRSILAPGLDAFEARTGVPVVGVVPYDDPGLPAEDSLSLPPVGEGATRGGDDGVPDDRAVTVGVVRLPRVSNATDVEPLAATPGVRVAYRPPDDPLDVDAVVLPGTKNAVDDLRACRAAGLGARLRSFDGPIVGLCGGYQLLGARVRNAGLEAAGGDGPDVVDGLGLLPVETRFEPDKRVAAVTWHVDGDAAGLPGASGPIEGYEIHAGRTRAVGDGRVACPFAREPTGPGSVELGAARGSVLGTYLHGLFENGATREAFVDRVYESAGRERPTAAATGSDPADRAARLVREHLDLDALGLPA